MQLIEELEASLAKEDSYFRQHLIKEDLARLRTLQELAASAADCDDFITSGMGIGWTQNDMRTHQIKDAIQAFLTVFHAYKTDPGSPENDDRLRAAWRAFDTERMEKLIRCL